MIRRFAIASLLTVASAAGLSSTASAVEGDVNFTAENAKKCVVGTAGPITLDQISNAAGFTVSLEGNAQLTAQCNSNANVSSTVTRTGGAPQLANQTVTHGPNTVAYVEGNNGQFTIPVSINASNGGNILPAATYNYTATVTVAPL